MTLRLITAPAVEPLSASLLRTRLRLDSDTSNPELDEIAGSVRERVENYTRRRLITQTVELTLDGFPSVIRLPVAPVQSITSVTYTDGAGDSQVLSASAYRLVVSQHPPLVAPVYGGTWPVTRDDFDSVKVRFVVGYGASGEDVPASLRQAMYLLAAHEFDQRRAMVEAAAAEMPLGVSDVLAPWVVWV